VSVKLHFLELEYFEFTRSLTIPEDDPKASEDFLERPDG